MVSGPSRVVYIGMCCRIGYYFDALDSYLNIIFAAVDSVFVVSSLNKVPKLSQLKCPCSKCPTKRKTNVLLTLNCSLSSNVTETK